MTEEQYEKINKNAENYLNRTPMQNPIRISSIRSAYIAGATEATKELQEQIEKLNKELEEYKSIDKRLICNHKYFTSDTKNNNLAVICHSILSCDMCGRWEEE